MHPNNTISLYAEHVYVIGNLHLGDGTRSDPFCLGDSVTKRDRMRDLIKEVRACDGHLVINGDLMDLQQGWSIDRVITANAILFRELSDLGKEGKLTYIWSELDRDLSYFEELLGAQTASHVHILSSPQTHDDTSQDEDNSTTINEHHTATSDVWAEIVQGFRFNPTIPTDTLPNLRGKRVQHLIERLLGTWIRFPLENFPTLENRIFFWMLHKVHWLGKLVGTEKGLGQRIHNALHHAYANQVGDPNQVWQELHRQLNDDTFTPSGELLVLGHSHLPGVTPLVECNTTFINTGSWIFDSQTVLHLEPSLKKHTLLDWHSKKSIEGAPYAHLTSTHPAHQAITQNDFEHWWTQHYKGWLNYHFATSTTEDAPNAGDLA